MATSFDASTNFGYGTIAVAPSPATTGTTFSLSSGEGASFPDTSTENDFNVVVFPDNAAYPTKANAEIVRVTARSGDDFTITREQEGTSAISIATGYKVLLSFTALGRINIEDAINTLETTLDPFVGGGWVAVNDTWTYASATSFTIAGVDRTSVLTKGTRLKLTQTTTKYFAVASSSFSTNTTVDVIPSTDYSIANAAITAPYYSYAANPQGWPGWFGYTVTVTPGGSMTWGSDSSVAQWFVVGNACKVHISARGTTGGTADPGLALSLPVPKLNAARYAGCGFVYSSDSNFKTALVFTSSSAGSTTVSAAPYDNSNYTLAGGTGARVFFEYQF